MEIVTLVEFALEIWYTDNDGQILPYITSPELQSLSHEIWYSYRSSRCFSALDSQDSLTFEAIEVFGEATPVSK